MADAHGSGPCARKGVGVQLPPRARQGLRSDTDSGLAGTLFANGLLTCQKNDAGDLLRCVAVQAAVTWLYVSSVMPMLACPSRSCTTLGCTPAREGASFRQAVVPRTRGRWLALGSAGFMLTVNDREQATAVVAAARAADQSCAAVSATS
jgi:hypothetical protein